MNVPRSTDPGAGCIDLTQATVVVRSASGRSQEGIAAKMLSEEVGRRTGRSWPVSELWPEVGPAVAVVSGPSPTISGRSPVSGPLETRTEGYSLATETTEGGDARLWVCGADPAGVLFGAGRLLRSLHWRPSSCWIDHPLNLSSAPRYAIRGHQLGYRATANSYDAWDMAQYEQYIRELAFFGSNCIENIPFQDHDSPVMKVPRWEMNIALSQLCAKYDQDYWVWTPASYDLRDSDLRAKNLYEYDRLARDCPRLDAIFFPGGDPGNNPPELVMPFLEEVSQRILPHHPKAGIWISLQGFDKVKVDAFYDWVKTREPAWLAGVVSGPSSPPIPETRARLDRRYGHRHYPDITHTVRSQYPTPWWDPAFAFTLGREPVNPEPLRYAEIHNAYAPYTDGFLSYSDGAHDDVNKVVWSALAWDPEANVRDVLVEYGRVFFGTDASERAADGILCLERNWQGSLAMNAGVEATLGMWTGLEQEHPGLAGDWRWQMCLLRAHYDAFVRARLLSETRWEEEACRVLAQAETLGSQEAMSRALRALQRPECPGRSPRIQALRERVIGLCESLFNSIGLQTSVEKYHASGSERGAVLDFIDIPLNNRWWIQDEMAKAVVLPTEPERAAHLRRIGTWECPEPGALYDDIGNVGKCPHVIRGEASNTDPNQERNPSPDVMWWNNGRSRYRQSWITKMDWPLGLRYEGLDPQAHYVVRTTGYRDCLLKANGVRLTPTLDGREIGEIKEFPVPPELTRDRCLLLTFDVPHEPDLNWRLQSRLCEVWLLKR